MERCRKNVNIVICSEEKTKQQVNNVIVDIYSQSCVTSLHKAIMVRNILYTFGVHPTVSCNESVAIVTLYH